MSEGDSRESCRRLVRGRHRPGNASITVGETLTIDDYWAIDAQLGPDTADRLISEVADCTDDGLHVLTVWQSRAHRELFIIERFVPAFQPADVQPGPLTFTNPDLHAFYVNADQPIHR